MRILRADAKLKEAQSLYENNLPEALRLVTYSISIYFEIVEYIKNNPKFEASSKNINVKIKEANIFQSELQANVSKLIDIEPIYEEIESEKLTCPFCGELIEKESRTKMIVCSFCGTSLSK